MNNLQLIENILYYIDEHLDENITFEYLAEKFHYSAFHFHRIFSAVTGQSITDYLKKRRLMYAYKDLLETEKPITDICYTYGFNSIQTFNRLFKDTYNVKPSDLRKSHMENTFRSIDTILAGYKKRVQFKGDFITEPRIINKEEFILAGYRKHTSNGFQVIGEAWQELKANMDKIKRVNSNTMYGFEDYSEDFCREPLQFYYMAAVEIERDTDVLEKMYVKKVPESLYAVFSVNGNNKNNEIYKAFQYIYNVWLPNSEYCLSDELCADFEYYDERWNCQSASSQIDIYIPIKKEELLC